MWPSVTATVGKLSQRQVVLEINSFCPIEATERGSWQGLNCVPPKFMLEFLSPGTQNVSLFRNRAIADVIIKSEVMKGTLITIKAEGLRPSPSHLSFTVTSVKFSKDRKIIYFYYIGTSSLN